MTGSDETKNKTFNHVTNIVSANRHNMCFKFLRISGVVSENVLADLVEDSSLVKPVGARLESARCRCVVLQGPTVTVFT